MRPARRIGPHGYLTGVLAAIVNGHKQSDIDGLMPWSYIRTNEIAR